MPRAIWDGTGEAGDAVTFTTNDGTIRGRPYVRERARLALLRRSWPLEVRQDALKRTVDNDEWLAWRAGQLVAAVCRDVVEAGWESWEVFADRKARDAMYGGRW